MTLAAERSLTVSSQSVSPGPTEPAAPQPLDDRLRGWLVTAFITALAAITRFIMLNHPTDGGTPVFDEKHYAPQAWQLIHNGWIEDNPGYGLVVHPPVGKMMIGLGELIFGYDGWGWRFGAAVSGTILVLLIVRITRRLAGSTMIGAIAGVLAICDGVLFVTSRIGMLDIFLALFVVAAFGCLVVDRDDMRARYAAVAREGRIGVAALGPRMGVRWWRFGAGILLGLACGTKWSGLYFIAFFGVLSVLFDLSARRAYGVRRPWLGTLVRDVPSALYALVVLPILIYLATFAGWFASETGTNRHAEGLGIGDTSRFDFIPNALRSLWYYSGNILEFHEKLTNSAGNRHPWESKPWTWPMGLRPMLYYFSDGSDVTGCSQEPCVRAQMLVGTPALWWLAIPLMLWIAYRAIIDRDWRFATVLTGYLAALAPWFLTMDRQMYYFYATTMAPFLMMGLALALGVILGPSTASADRRATGMFVVCGYLGIVVANFVWLWPILTGMPISEFMWHQHLWLPSWR